MIDINKKYTTRSGLPVQFTIKDNLIDGDVLKSGQWRQCEWNLDGKCTYDSNYDLIEVPQVVEMTVIDAFMHINRQVAKTSMSDEQAVLMDKCFTILLSLVKGKVDE